MNDNIKIVIALCSVFAAIAIAFCALYIPPVGIIDSSVLWFIAQTLLFAASIIGIDFKIRDVFKKS